MVVHHREISTKQGIMDSRCMMQMVNKGRELSMVQLKLVMRCKDSNNTTCNKILWVTLKGRILWEMVGISYITEVPHTCER